MAGRDRRSSMSSRDEERIIDEYRKQLGDKASRNNESYVRYSKPKNRSVPISPYLQSVAPRSLSTIQKRVQSMSQRRRKIQYSKIHSEKHDKSVWTGSVAEDDTTDNYSSSFESSDSDDSNEKENHRGQKKMEIKTIQYNRPSSAPAHRRRHTHDGSTDTESVKSENHKNIPVYKRQPYTIRCKAYKNGSHLDGVTVVAADIKQLLVEATRKLALNTAGRRVYLQDGSEAFVARDIPFDAKVYISNGEQFKDPRKTLNSSGSLLQSNTWTTKGVVLEADRKPARRTASNRLRRLAGMQSYRILVFMNGNGADGQEVIFGSHEKYSKLLDQCTSKLKMNAAARITYGWDGKEVSTLEEIRRLDSCMKDGSTLIHGPLWISSGEGFKPVGASNFVEGIIWGINQRMDAAQLKSEQLDYMCNGEMSKVRDKDVINMPMDDVYSSIEQISEEMEEMKSAKKKYEERLEVLNEMKKKQKDVGSSYTMRHIKEIKSDDRIVGQHGLRLTIFENGKDVNGQTVFINMREIFRGTGQEQNPDDLIKLRFLEHISHWHRPIDPTGPAKSTLVKRMFDETGEEIKNIKELKNDQQVWLSYGEDFKPCFIMALHVMLQPVMGLLLEGRDKIVLRRDGEVDIKSDTKWQAHDEFPKNFNCFTVQTIAEKSEVFGAADHYLQSVKDPELVVKPILMADKKLEKKPMPGTSQAWLVHRNGLITSRSYPQLALCLDENQPITVEMSCGAEVTGYALTLQKRTRGNPAQQWEFSSNGQICSLYNPSSNMVLTMLDPENFNAIEAKDGRIYLKPPDNDGDQNALSQLDVSGYVRIAVLEKLTGSRAKFQRWALKQEKIPNQWKNTKVANPMWKKLAYSWPVLPDGNWNLDYKWPMEGSFISCPPHLRGKEKRDATTTVPLKVLRNGEKNPGRFVSVVVPDLSASSLANDKSVADAETNVIKLEMNMFLERATSLLNLPFAARRIFNAHGRELFSLRKVKRNEIVYISCGEQWQNPTVTKSEAQRRQLLAKLSTDVKKVHEYCVLRDPGKLVITMEKGVVDGTRLVVAHQVEKAESQDQDDSKKNTEIEVERKTPEEEAPDFRTCHQRSHESSDGWVAARKYPWQLEKEKEPEKEEKVEKSQTTPRSASRSPRTPLKSPKLLQKFLCKDGFISPEVDSSLAFGVPGLDLETFTGTLEVRLCKKDIDDLTQRWDIKSDGTIRPMCDNTSGLAVCLPPISNEEERSPKSYCVILQKLKPHSIGSANQKWHYNPRTHLIEAFSSNVADKEVTAANHVSVCTHSVRGPEPLNQDGFIVEMKGSLPSNPVIVCRSCASVMRGGKYPLTHAPTNWSFICAMGDPKKHGLKMQGSFKCLNGKIDLSTYEAEPTLNHWASQLQRLRQETSMRSISRDINNVAYTQAWRLLVRKNGEGYRAKPEMVTGSSVTGILDQCSQKLSLASAARRLYTEDGTHILHMDQLKQWIKRTEAEHRKGSLVQHNQDRSTDAEKDTSNTEEVKPEKQNDGNNSTEGTPDHSTAEYGTQDLTRKPKKRNQPSITQAVTEQLISEHQQLPTVEIWVSCGENFINPVMADKMNQESIVAHIERNAVNLEMDTQRHVIRQMHGRRRGHLNPAELVPTKDVRKPVVVKGGWTEATKEEDERMGMYNQIKESQKTKKPRTGARLQGNLYKQPQMKRIVVRALDDPTSSVYAWGESIDSLLDDAATKLGVRRIERVFYTKEGKKIKKFAEIARNAELFVNPKRPGSTIRMKTVWARTRKSLGPEATEIVVTGPRNEKSIAYVRPTNEMAVDSSLSSSSSSSSSESDNE